MNYRQFFVLYFLMTMGLITAECQQPYGFERYDEIVVYDADNNLLAFPWAGGLNAVQLNKIDLNNDAFPDLVCFDRLGNRILTFVYNNAQWEYAPEYQKVFPELVHWMILKDYNGDGRKDIFTYTTGGIKVFKNTGSSDNQFTQVTDPYITSLQGSIYTNILVTYADYPGIADIDYDGDLDILTFWGLGSFVEMHKNLSMETYGNSDSLLFEKTTFCWGHFAESEESNVLFLDTCVNTGSIPPAQKHTGSTFLLFDKDQDNDYDLLLGDVDYPTMALLENGGDSDEAHMINQTKIYPADDPLFLYSFPAAFLEDVDFDGLEDLIVTPFDPSPNLSAVNHNILLYKNQGDYDFQFVQDDFLQSDMIDLGAGAYPCFCDWNRDGLMDIVVGNEGVNDTCFMDEYFTLHCSYHSSLSLYINTGTVSLPEYKLMDDDFGNLAELELQGLNPTVGDIDNDGDMDIVCGTLGGAFILLENTSGTFPPQFHIDHNTFNGFDISGSSAPDLFDIDNDGDLDLLSGCEDGFIYWFKNTTIGSSLSFALVNDKFGNVDVRDLNVSYNGYSTPVFRKNQNGAIELFVGAESGRIFMYNNIDDNLSGTFNLVSGDLHYLDPGERSDCTLEDINNDGYPEILIGNYSGGMTLYKGVWPPSGDTDLPKDDGIDIFPNPTHNQLHILPISDDVQIKGIWIYNSFGLLEISSDTKREYVDVSVLTPGLYFIQLLTTDGLVTKKFIKF